jgi:hypothetical protein
MIESKSARNPPKILSHPLKRRSSVLNFSSEFAVENAIPYAAKATLRLFNIAVLFDLSGWELFPQIRKPRAADTHVTFLAHQGGLSRGQSAERPGRRAPMPKDERKTI